MARRITPKSTAGPDARRILLVGDYSNCQATLAEALRRMGHEVTLAADGSRWLDTPRDIDLRRPSQSKIGGARLLARVAALEAAGRLAGYDFAVINHPVFLDLRPWASSWLLRRLAARNKAVFLAAMSHDFRYVDMCVSPGSPLPYSEWAVGGAPSPMRLARPDEFREWTTDPLRAQNEWVYSHVDGVTTALYEYHLAVERALPSARVCYTGLPVDVDGLPSLPPADKPRPAVFFLGRHSQRQDEKGTDLLEQAARRAISRHPGRAELRIVEDRPHAEYMELMRGADVVIDQLYSHTPAMNALQAMAMAKPVVGGGEETYYRFIGERANRPIINVRPGSFEALVKVFEQLVTAPPGRLRALGLASREFARTHNDAALVARRSLEFWQQRLDLKQHSR